MNLEADGALAEVSDGLNQVFQIAPQSVELPDHEHIAFAERLQASGETGPVVLRAGSLILIDVIGFDAGRVMLEVEDLRPSALETRM
jgi:hypothetical protein